MCEVSDEFNKLVIGIATKNRDAHLVTIQGGGRAAFPGVGSSITTLVLCGSGANVPPGLVTKTLMFSKLFPSLGKVRSTTINNYY